jgi:hypothetical protein
MLSTWLTMHSFRCSQDENATISFGVLGDVNLYRASQTELKTDSSLSVGGTVLAGPDKLDILAELASLRGLRSFL